MANFLVVVDPDPERRSLFIKTVETLIPPVEGLITNSCSTENFHAIWAANAKAPISVVSDEEGAGIIWGQAIPQDSSTIIDAKQLRNQWTSLPTQPPIFDGFYAAIVYEPGLGMRVGADLQGVFPVYYFTHGDVALVGSSQELFRYHPLFEAKFNPAGLVGILLLNNIFDGQTLWQNVRRLSAGHLLSWQVDSAAQEIKQHQIGDCSKDYPYSELSFPEHLELLENVIDRALHTQSLDGAKHNILLSGGLDSRILAGFLHRQKVDTVALTLGVVGDLEMQCAKAVARHLIFEHHPVTIPLEKYPGGFEKIVKWEHLANGCNWVMNWDIYPYLNNYGSRVVIGNSIELLMGAKASYKIDDPNISFEKFFQRGVNSWGFLPETLKKLLRPEIFGNLVDEILDAVKEKYQGYSTQKFKQALFFDFYNRQRFHVGSTGWQACFGAWPILPILDKELIETTAAFPPSTIIKRRAQNQLLCTRFPELAKLPLDRGTYYDTEPLLTSSIRQQLSLLFKLQKKWRRFQYKLGYERRYFQRIFDIENAGHREIRKQVEPNRFLVKELFDEQVFNQILPPPNLPVERVNYYSSAELSSRKALLGFLLWSQGRL
ncbi:MAG: hypothetical protein F6K23_16770 [Okeania sp. SIO2C9]|uniref:asparagine synthase-related protein n=1 Tax=Okeania sp. SIO2C9 TaxID=2607791 RepID=UPI0013C167E6|nr:asparagine synthase-related protein [Okeania sp. SIO2C9]NEQ74543.1 hypothetical protein [Okeania sp. SIO2C9]